MKTRPDPRTPDLAERYERKAKLAEQRGLELAREQAEARAIRQERYDQFWAAVMPRRDTLYDDLPAFLLPQVRE
jgi:hypothetical protein